MQSLCTLHLGLPRPLHHIAFAFVLNQSLVFPLFNRRLTIPALQPRATLGPHLAAPPGVNAVKVAAPGAREWG